MASERVILQLDGTGDPIRGSLEGGGGEPLSFSGYVELISVLETLRGAGSDNAGTGDSRVASLGEPRRAPAT